MNFAMTLEEFSRHFSQNAAHMMWLLGAGASRSAGMPTATDIIWDLKRQLYCTNENIDIQSQDINNKALRSKIQNYMLSKGFPDLWSPEEYSFYFEKIFGRDHSAQQKYLNNVLSPEKISINTGHRALAAMMAMNLTKAVYTTNFDEVLERAFTFVSEKPLSAFHLEGSYAALDALNNEIFPLYAKIHGDFRYQSIKNISEDLIKNDAEIMKCFLASATRYGLIVSGYSGRDENVMAMLKSAIDQNNSFPQGLFWTTTDDKPVLETVKQLIDYARSKNIDSAIINTGTFDETLSRLWKVIPNKNLIFDHKVRTASLHEASINLPNPGRNFPVIRTNALPIIGVPATCGAVNYTEAMTHHDLKEGLSRSNPSTQASFTDRVIFWGNKGEIAKALNQNKITGFSTYDLNDPENLISESTHIKSFFEGALVRAICNNKPLWVQRHYKIYNVIVSHKEKDNSIFKPLVDALTTPQFKGYISGKVPGLNDVYWSEAISLKLEEKNGRLWLLLRPDIWVTPSNRRQEATDFLRKKKLYRWNSQSNAILDAWINILLGSVGGGETKRVECYSGSDFPAVFEISTRTAYSRKE